ncbi:MAG: type II toxin-antitoxin system VapC family toxin [Actinopolymorphaceae bacterium]
MRMLLDTHVVLWWLADDPTLADEVKSTIDDELDVFVSAATVWEIGIKQALGKLQSPLDLGAQVRDSDLGELPIRFDHAIAAAALPRVHRDPFDRMLIAQARCERLTLVTRDPTIQTYDVDTLPV